MKNVLSLCMTLCLLASACQPTPNVEETVTTPPLEAPFTISIEEDTTRPHLPALHSFVLATSDENWLLFAGRTNGMHDFGGDHYEDGSFPHVDFNRHFFVCDATTCDSLPVSIVPIPYQDIFKATNLQHVQIGNDLYVSGGYGENPTGDTVWTERWDTYDIIAKIDVPALVAAVKTQDAAAAVEAMMFGQDKMVEATGGEFFKMGDYFYLAGGHIYNGFFSSEAAKRKDTLGVQTYLNAVHRFKLEEREGQLVVSDASKITDGKTDSTTQFRRRDLPIAKTLQATESGLTSAISLYAGVFTSPQNKIPELKANANFTHPIHIFQDGSYHIDTTYTQNLNVYAAPNFVVYDGTANTYHTTIIGGIGDGSPGINYTNTVLTVNHSLDPTIATTESLQDSIPVNGAFYGAEANILLSEATKVAGTEVFDLTSVKSGEQVDIGLFYGGIHAFVNNPGGYGRGKSIASNKVFRMKITKR
ncbi:MAG: hypothetical protein AAF798_00455 [Bacteroidota bacterium]